MTTTSYIDLREAKASIRRILREKGPQSQSELLMECKLPESSLNNAIGLLLSEGVIEVKRLAIFHPDDPIYQLSTRTCVRAGVEAVLSLFGRKGRRAASPVPVPA